MHREVSVQFSSRYKRLSTHSSAVPTIPRSVPMRIRNAVISNLLHVLILNQRQCKGGRKVGTLWNTRFWTRISLHNAKYEWVARLCVQWLLFLTYQHDFEVLGCPKLRCNVKRALALWKGCWPRRHSKPLVRRTAKKQPAVLKKVFLTMFSTHYRR